MRLRYLTFELAQAAADSLHARMIANDLAYAASVNAGQTTAWAVPYEEGGFWYVNCKERCRVLLTAPELLALVPYRSG